MQLSLGSEHQWAVEKFKHKTVILKKKRQINPQIPLIAAWYQNRDKDDKMTNTWGW